jgi:hypothetical protein
MSRTIIDVLTSRHGNPINIYAIDNSVVTFSEMTPYTTMEVSYRLGERTIETFTKRFIDATANFRSLIFEHPTKGEGRVIIIPTNNILSLEIIDK